MEEFCLKPNWNFDVERYSEKSILSVCSSIFDTMGDIVVVGARPAPDKAGAEAGQSNNLPKS